MCISSRYDELRLCALQIVLYNCLTNALVPVIISSTTSSFVVHFQQYLHKCYFRTSKYMRGEN